MSGAARRVAGRKLFMKAMSSAVRMGATSTFQAPAILTRISVTADGGLTLGFHTNELTPEEKLTAMNFHQQFGWVLFRQNQFEATDVPDVDAPTDEEKTPSQRLRGALFVLWESQGSKGTFREFYEKHMEQAINRVKKLLD